MHITLADIDAFEGHIKNVRVILQGIGREIYKMREGKELGPEYGFDAYSRENFAGCNYVGQEGPDWGAPCPIFSLRYYWPRAENIIYVTFPQGWLEQDWRALETERLRDQRAKAEQIAETEARERKERREISERETYERLKSKFEAPRP